MRNLGLIVFSSHSGLGYQSRRLAQFLKPERILLIDNSGFSRNTEQHPEWYEGFSGYTIDGFPSNATCSKFVDNLTHLYIIENPLNWDLIGLAQSQDAKVYIASNFEFCDNLINPHLPLPDTFLMPSYWKLSEMELRFGKKNVQYLPPPVFPEEFATVREHNFNRSGKKRFLHIVGTLAAADRNGTQTILEALYFCKEDFELVIKTQHELPTEYDLSDKRIRYSVGSEPDVATMYRDFDAMVMPRRFGGLCLPMQEGLMSGLPVIMTDISPNREILPKEWLIPATQNGMIITRTEIELYDANPRALAQKIDYFCKKDLERDKIDAFDIGHREFAPSSLEERYNSLW